MSAPKYPAAGPRQGDYAMARLVIDLRGPATGPALNPDGSIPFELSPAWRAWADTARQVIAARRQAEPAPPTPADNEETTP